MRSLHLLVPGLFWLDPADTRPYGSITLPGIETLLTRGRLEVPAAGGYESWLAGRFGLPGADAPTAALAAGGDTGETWLNADPVNLSPRGAELFLAAGEALGIGSGEAAALAGTLNEFFREDGLEFRVLRPHRWVVRAPAGAAPPRTVPLSAAHGRAIEPLLPGGGDARVWLKRMNEAQMLLHAHPANERREERGLPTVNSVWFSGAGRFVRPPGNPYDTVASPEPWVTALARAAGARLAQDELPAQGAALAEATRGRTLLHVVSCWQAAACADEPAWREALAAMESDYVQPALVALRTGMIDSLALTGFGGREGLTATLGRLELLRFWRRHRGLAPVASIRGH